MPERVAVRKRNEKVGQVVSNKMAKTIVVEVSRRVPHRLYKRVVSKRKKFYAHDENNSAQVGDVVRIEESRRHDHTEFALVIPPDRMNDVLWDVDLAGLLTPTQEITGLAVLHVRLEERFATLTWVDRDEEAGVSQPSVQKDSGVDA